MPPQVRVSTRRGVGVVKRSMEPSKEVIPQAGVRDAKLKRSKQELDDVVLQVAEYREDSLSRRGCLRLGLVIYQGARANRRRRQGRRAAAAKWVPRIPQRFQLGYILDGPAWPPRPVRRQ